MMSVYPCSSFSFAQVLDTRSNQIVSSFRGHRDTIARLAFRQGTYELFSASYDRTIKIWSLSDQVYVETLYGHQNEVTCIACARRERPISAGTDRTCRVWKVEQARDDGRSVPLDQSPQNIIIRTSPFSGTFFVCVCWCATDSRGNPPRLQRRAWLEHRQRLPAHSQRVAVRLSGRQLGIMEYRSAAARHSRQGSAPSIGEREHRSLRSVGQCGGQRQRNGSLCQWGGRRVD